MGKNNFGLRGLRSDLLQILSWGKVGSTISILLIDWCGWTQKDKELRRARQKQGSSPDSLKTYKTKLNLKAEHCKLMNSTLLTHSI